MVHPNRPSTGIERCPYLGLHDDSSTALAYPSAWNYCYRASPPASILVEHQVETCLCPHYTDCAVYVSNKWASLPSALRGKATARTAKPGWLRRLGLFLLLIVLVISGIVIVFPEQVAPYRSQLAAFLTSRVPAFAPGSDLILDPEASVLEGGAAQTTPVIAATKSPVTAQAGTGLAAAQAGATGLAAVPNASQTQSLSMTPPGTCGHALDEPFGENPSFLIHRVLSGENLTLYAEQYQTTTDAILAVNYHLPMPVWEDWIIVIPVGTEVADIPPFEPYQALGTSISLGNLAEELNTDPQALYKYNAFSGVCRVFSGWLLIPRKPAAP